MTITLDHIRPHPLPDVPSAVWGRQTTIESGAGYLVTAPSGKGKSTLLHIMYGLRTDYDGVLEFDGRPALSMDPDQWADIRSHRLAVVYQDLRLFGHLTARQNIEIKRQLAPRIDASRAVEMATQLGIAGVLDQAASTLSYGQRQRVAIIRALCQPFEMLLLDEPFSHLDADNIGLAKDLIREACVDQRAGYVLVSLGPDYGFSFNHHLTL
jgi:ABC-type lipoprotein export system ATPase subunit